jgi:hypothetical protein
MFQRILALVAGFLVMVTVGGWGHQARPAGTGQLASARAVQALSADAPDAVGLLPTDFPTVMGYRPVAAVTGGKAGPTRGDGGCSSPFGGTRYGFTPDCRQHDLGYDLLRYADAKGQPLGPWARHAIDAHFARQARARCGGLGCRIAAATYAGAVRFNSWRQGYGPPVVEPATAFAVPIAAGLATAGLLGLLAPAPLPRRRPVPLSRGALRGRLA